MTRRRSIEGSWKLRIDRNYYNLNTFCLSWFEQTGRYGFPVLERSDYVPDRLFPFDERNKYRDGDGAVHFYCEDCEFENVWLRAARYPHAPAVVLRAGVVLTPDFSVFTDFPLATQIWNVYRSRLLGALWQSIGLEVIPSVVWGVPETFEWCFDGLPMGGTLAVSTGHVSGRDESLGFLKGFRELVKRCQPETVLCYGRGLKGGLESLHPNVKRFDSRLTEIYYARKAEAERSMEVAIG